MTWLKHLLVAPVFDDEDKTRAAGLLHIILLTLMVGAALVCPVLGLMNPASMAFDLEIGGAMVVTSLILLLVSHRGYVRTAGTLLSLALMVINTFSLYVFGGIRSMSSTAYFIVVIIASLLLGGSAALVFGGLSILCALGIFYAEIAGAIPSLGSAPATLPDFVILAFSLGVATLLLRSAVRSIAAGFQRARRNERALTDSNREMEASRSVLETRTHDLERRSVQLRAAAEVGHAAASIHVLDELLPQVARLISQQFGFYHVGIFLLEETGRYVALRATNSEGGQQMLAQGYQLEVGRQGIVGYVAGNKEPRIALDVGQDAAHFENPFLPRTRSEMALPLVMGDQLLGVLDVQSDQASAFTQDDVAVLRVVADEVAVAISNARLLQQVQESLEAERRAYGQISREAWAQLLRARTQQGYLCDSRGTVQQITRQWRPEMVNASREGQAVQPDDATVALPVKVRDQAVGAVRLRKPEGAGEWTAEEIALMGTLTEQLGVALESARLYQDTQRRAAQERLVGQVTSRIRETLDVETVLKTTADEMRAALGLERLVVRLGTPEPDNQPQA